MTDMTDLERFIAAADALAEAVKPFAGRLDRLETMTAAKYAVGTDIDVIYLRNARAALTDYRAAREAITPQTPPAFATSA
jgi:hypothetical protein